jgi:hypothetical protein
MSNHNPYLNKRYCKSCGEWVDKDILWYTKHGIFHRECGRRVRLIVRRPEARKKMVFKRY